MVALVLRVLGLGQNSDLVSRLCTFHYTMKSASKFTSSVFFFRLNFLCFSSFFVYARVFKAFIVLVTVFQRDLKKIILDIKDMGSIPGSGRSPGEGRGNPLQYSCLENPLDRGTWWASGPQGCTELDTTEVTQHSRMHCFWLCWVFTAVWAFSSYGVQLPIEVASLVAEHGALAQESGALAQLLHSIRTRGQACVLTLSGRFFTTEPQEEPCIDLILNSGM